MIFVGQIVFDLWILTYETILVREAGGPHLKCEFNQNFINLAKIA